MGNILDYRFTSYISDYEPLFGTWHTNGLLGEGSSGEVWKVRREKDGKIEYSAVRMINIPRSEADVDNARREFAGDSDEVIAKYFRSFVMDIVQKIDIMHKFRDEANVLSFQEHKVIKRIKKMCRYKIHWSILLRMELLQPLGAYMTNHPLTADDTIRLGLDISRALELLASEHLIHGRIEPDNIFVSEDGKFKLDVFGSSKYESDDCNVLQQGILAYMTPEVYNAQPYGKNIDLYSLGMLMYRLLNKNRPPFLPTFPKPISPEDHEKALYLRMKGEVPLPDIPNTSPELNAFVLKACAFRPEDRFTDASEFRAALEKLRHITKGNNSHKDIDIKDYEPLFGVWYADELLSERSLCKVWRVRRERDGKIDYSAVKMISIPYDEAQINQVRLDFPKVPDMFIAEYFKGFVMDLVREIDIMQEFRDKANIVSVEEHQVIRKDDLHWDILIRMELLRNLGAYFADHRPNTDDIIKLGLDISRALEVCSKKSIIHRDIKPDNIFVSEDGDFKLGDLGVARHIEQRISAEMSLKGTRTYMAPEVYNNQPYGPNVDLYSLGIVMYCLLNNNRLPFMPPFPEPITASDREKALSLRMRGEVPLPDIPDIHPELNAFILKACAFRPEDRFTDASEFRAVLQKLRHIMKGESLS